MTYRRATTNDCPLLAELNHQLIRDEGHRNRMTVPELEQRMRDWLAGEYTAILFEDAGEVVAYALYREQPEEIYLRQLFILRPRRRQGLGKQAMRLLHSEIWPKTKRITVEVLVANTTAVAFWRTVGYRDYSLALEISPAGPDFLFDALPVGRFEESLLPDRDGRYRYMPYRGDGHYKMQNTLRAGGNVRCYYQTGNERVCFTVEDCPEYGTLTLSHFERMSSSAT